MKTHPSKVRVDLLIRPAEVLSGIPDPLVLKVTAHTLGWAHWHLNDNATGGSKPISYAELVRRTGIDLLPGVNLGD